MYTDWNKVKGNNPYPSRDRLHRVKYGCTVSDGIDEERIRREIPTVSKEVASAFTMIFMKQDKRMIALAKVPTTLYWDVSMHPTRSDYGGKPTLQMRKADLMIPRCCAFSVSWIINYY